jgi:hypothetical protein
MGTILSWKPNNTIDRPIYYANKLMNSVEKNYTTTEKETLGIMSIYYGFFKI